MDISFKKLRQSIAGVTVLALLSTFVGTGVAFADWQFADDEPSDSELAQSLMDAYDEGWLTGYGETGESGWEDSLQRDQAAKISVLAFLGEDEVVEADEAPFTDVSMDDWSVDYVNTAVEYGFVQGYSDTDGDLTGYYGPADTLNNAQWAIILMRAMGVSADTTEDADSFPSTDEDSWWAEAYQTLYAWGNDWVMDAEPGDEITRGEVSLWTNTAQDPEYRWEDGDDDDDDDDDTNGSDADATVVVELSDESPDAMTIADKATSVAVAAWDFTAEDGDVELDGLTVHNYALSDPASDSELYIYMGSERLTTGKTQNSSTDLATFNNLDVEIDEGETVTLTLRLNVGDRTTTGEAGYELEDVDAVDAGDADVSGDFPVMGAKHELATTEVGTLTIEKNGSISNPTVGGDEETIAKFKLTAGTNAASIQELGLYLAGSVDSDDVQNFKLYASGVSDALAEVESVDNQDVIRFVLDDDYEDDADDEECDDDAGWCISDGSSKTFYVEADFNTGRTSDTVKVYVDEKADVLAVDARRDFGMQVDIDNTDGYDGTSCTSSSGKCSYSALDGGEVTMAMENISNRSIVIDQADVSLMNFTVTAETDVTFRDFVLQLTSTESAGDDTAGLIDDASTVAPNFTDIRVKATDGSHTWGPVDADSFVTAAGGSTAISSGTDSAAAFYRFTDDFEMAAGDSVDFQVLVDVANQSALADETITAAVYIDSSYPELRDENNTTLTNSSSLVPTSTMTGDSFTIESTSLTVAKDESVGDDTVVVGSNDVEMVAFAFGAGSAEAVTITDLTLTGYVYNDTDAVFDAGFDDDDSDGTQETGEYSFSEIVLSLDLYEDEVSEENKINSSAAAANGTTGVIEFEDIDWELDVDETKILIVTGDFSNNSTYNGADVKLDIADVSAHVEAVDEDGDTITSGSSDTPNGGASAVSSSYTEITVSSGGTLSVDVPTQTSLVPASQIVVAGTDDNLFGTLRFTSTNESFVIEEFALKNDFSSSAGDYDDNIERLKVQYYTDEEQTEPETTTCSSSSTTDGVYVCRGLDVMVPDPDINGAPNYANVRIYADMQGTSDIDAGDKPDFTLSLADDFDAYGDDSSTRIQKTDLTITDLSSLGTADTGIDLDTTISAATTTSLVGDATFASVVVPGDYICVDIDTATGSCSGLEVMYVSAVSTTTLTVVRGVNGTTATTYTADSGDDSIQVFGSADTTMDAMATNYMQVQKADLSIEAADSSVSGKSLSTSDTIMTLEVTAVGDEDVSIRTGLGAGDTGFGEEAGDTVTALSGGPSSASRVTSAPTPFAGTYAVKILDSSALADGDGATVDAGTAGVLDNFSYASIWLYINDASSNDSLTGEDIELVVTDVATAADHVFNVGSSTAITESAWMFFPDIALSGLSSEEFFGIKMDAAMTDAGDYVAFDDARFYNDKLNVDLATNASAWAGITPSSASLKQDGTTVATGYVDFDGATSTKTGQVTFTPVGTYGEIQISGSSTLTVVINTSAAIANAADSTETITATIDMGNVSTGGDIYWYDQASSLNFFGVNSDDKIEVTNSY